MPATSRSTPGVVYAFCSVGCRARFVKDPAAYVGPDATGYEPMDDEPMAHDQHEDRGAHQAHADHSPHGQHADHPRQLTPIRRSA